MQADIYKRTDINNSNRTIFWSYLHTTLLVAVFQLEHVRTPSHLVVQTHLSTFQYKVKWI